jgi:hypothetical protein
LFGRYESVNDENAMKEKKTSKEMEIQLRKGFGSIKRLSLSLVNTLTVTSRVDISALAVKFT